MQGLPEPPPGEGTPDDDGLFAMVAALVPPTVLTELLAARLHLPVLESEGDVDASANELLAAAVATRCAMVPITTTGQTLEVAAANPLDLDAVKTVEFATGKRVRVRVATLETVRRALNRLYGDEAAPKPAPAPAAPAVTPAPAVEPPQPDPTPAEAAVDATPPDDAAVADEAAPAEGEVLLEAEVLAEDVEAEQWAAEEPAPALAVCAETARMPRVLVLVGDAVERERLGGAVRDGEPAWLVVTAQDAGEGALMAAVVQPDVVIVDAATDDLGGGCLAASPLLVADEYESVDHVITLARTLIDTARSG